MLKRILSILIMLVFAGTSLFAIDYSELRSTMEELVSVYENFITGMDEAETAGEVVTAVNAWSDGIAAMEPKMAAIEEKYPEIVNLEEPPAEIADLVELMNTMEEDMQGALMKLFQFSQDPEVDAAIEALQQTGN
jgi:hypothetical protein